MRIFDAHNDYFTSKKECDFSKYDFELRAIFAVWGTRLKSTEILSAADKVLKSGNLLSFEDVSPVDDFSEIIVKDPAWCSLTWNYDNALAGGALGANFGLTAKGRKVVKLFENSGIFLDLAHLSRTSAMEVIKTTDLPIVNSHACVYELNPHPRNMRLADIKEVIYRGGFFGVCLHGPFLRESGIVRAGDVARHVDVIVQRFGIDGVGIGADYYGSDCLPGDLSDYQKFGYLAFELKRLGYGDDAVDAILYGNLSRVIKRRFEA